MGDLYKNKHKEKYRQSNAKHWCSYCKVFIMNNEQSKKRHEASTQHKDAIKRYVDRLEKMDREKRKLLDEFSQASGVNLAAKPAGTTGAPAASSFYKQTPSAPVGAVPVPLLSVRPPAAPRLIRPQSSAPPPGTSRPPATLEDKKADKEKFMAQAAIIGQWEAVQERPAPPQNVQGDPSETPAEALAQEFTGREKISPIIPEDAGSSVEFLERSAPTSRRNIRR